MNAAERVQRYLDGPVDQPERARLEAMVREAEYAALSFDAALHSELDAIRAAARRVLDAVSDIDRPHAIDGGCAHEFCEAEDCSVSTLHECKAPHRHETCTDADCEDREHHDPCTCTAQDFAQLRALVWP